MVDHILCCDWGTSSFRLRIVDTINYFVMLEVESKEGISAVFNEWKRDDRQNRQSFFMRKLSTHIQSLEERSGMSLSGVPVILSGMASSSIGMEEIAYADLPFELDGSGARTKKYNDTDDFPHPLVLVSGVKSASDVMRGEEAQLIGLYYLDEVRLENKADYLFVFPGTHSKHIFTKGTRAVDFQTYMTGEIFNLMSTASILKDSVSLTEDLSLANQENLDAFKAGVQQSGTYPILHSLFTVRTNQLFSKFAKAPNALYLSGLLIGAEFTSLKAHTDSIVICSGRHLYDNYKVAAEELGLKNVTFIDSNLIDKATIAGQVQIYKQSSNA